MNATVTKQKKTQARRLRYVGVGACLALIVQASAALPLPPLPPPVPPKVVATSQPKRYQAATVTKGATLLVTKSVATAPASTNRMVWVGITVRVHHKIQFSSDLQSWATVTNYDEPTMWLSLPAPGVAGIIATRRVSQMGHKAASCSQPMRRLHPDFYFFYRKEHKEHKNQP